MSRNEIIVAAVLAIVVGVAVGLVLWEPTLRAFAELLGQGRFWLQKRRTGLKAIYPMSHRHAGQPLGKILQEATAGDEILLVGRTHVHVLERNKEAIARALETGVTFRLLLLDRKAIGRTERRWRVDLRPLGQRVTRERLVMDILKSEGVLKELRQKCLGRSLPGSLLAYRVDVLVQNSVVIHTPKLTTKPFQILFDLSFGDSPFDKFIQFYKWNNNLLSNNRDAFCTRLVDYYYRMLEDGRDPLQDDIAMIAYDLSYSPTE